MKNEKFNRSLYRLYDPDPSKGCHSVETFKEANYWSEKQWGIFWTVNEFQGPRVKENCTKIISWGLDLDSGSKDSQRERIRDLKLQPSMVVETARGHHVYFDAISADPDNYRDILERLIEKYEGDKNAKDICRILRVPGYLHWKDPKNPFVIKMIYSSSSAYTEDEMRKAFPVAEEKEKELDQKTETRTQLKFQDDQKLWERVWNLDCEEALKRISGSVAVNGEMFSFKRTSSGNLNIMVNGKNTSCWIDCNKRIGSPDKGGPTVWQWVNWYHRNHKKTYELLKQNMPELFK